VRQSAKELDCPQRRNLQEQLGTAEVAGPKIRELKARLAWTKDGTSSEELISVNLLNILHRGQCRAA
jgi:hypothetical protein